MEIQWALVLFTVIAGAGAWLFAWSVLGHLCKKSPTPTKFEAIVAFVLLVVGGFMSVLHLKHVDRILEALNHPTSGIFIEAAMIGVMCAIVAVYYILLMRGASEKALTIVGVLGMIVGIVFTYACGSSYTMESRPAWTSLATPLSYAGTCAAAGAAVNLLCKIVQKQGDEAVSFAGVLTIVGSVLGIVLAGWFCLNASAFLAASENGAMTWAIITFVALVATFVCGAVAYRKPGNALALAVIAVILGVTASITVRMVMWLTGTPVLDFFLMPLE